jgi:hypothetical protein
MTLQEESSVGKDKELHSQMYFSVANGMSALFYIMWCSSGPESSSCIKLTSQFTEKYSLSYRLGDKKIRPKRQFYFFFILFIVLELVVYFFHLLFIVNKCDSFMRPWPKLCFWWIFEMRLVNWDKFTWVFFLTTYLENRMSAKGLKTQLYIMLKWNFNRFLKNRSM